MGFLCFNSGSFNGFEEASCVWFDYTRKKQRILLDSFICLTDALDSLERIFVYLELFNVSKHPVDGAMDGIDELQTKLDPIAPVLRSLRSATADAGQLRHASCPRRAQAWIGGHYVPINQRQKMSFNRTLECVEGKNGWHDVACI